MMTTRRQFLLQSAAAAGAMGLGLASPDRLHGDIPRAPQPMRLLILGGTGFTGPHQVSYALARGHRITLFNRDRREIEWPGEVEELTGDRNTGDLTALQGREWDVCIDNPTTLPFWVRDAGRVLQNRVGHYIFISTISVYADNSRAGMDETTALLEYTGPDPMQETAQSAGRLYGQLKAVSEREAEKQFPGKTTVIRPGLIVGPRDNTDRFTYWPVRLDRGGEVLAPGDGTDAVQFIDARDLAEWTIRMAETRATGIYNATGPGRAMNMGQMLDGIRSAVGASARLTWVPAPFLAEQRVQPWSHMPVWVPAGEDNAGWGRVSIARAVDKGLTFRPFATTARETLRWFRTLPPERQATLSSGLPEAREREVLAAWHARD